MPAKHDDTWGPNSSNQVFKALMGVPPSPPHKTRFDPGMPQGHHSPETDVSPSKLQLWQQQQHSSPQAPIWAPPMHARLPPLEDQHNRVFNQQGRRSAPSAESKDSAAYALNNIGYVPRAPHLEPLVMNWAIPTGASIEDRVGMMEQRLMAAERASTKATSAYNMQSDIVVALSNDLQRTAAELGVLHMRIAAAANIGPNAQQHQHLEAQLQTLHAEMSTQAAALMHTQHQLADALKNNTELRSQVSHLSDELGRAAIHRAAADAAIDRLDVHMQHGAHSIAADQQRQLGAAEHRQALEMSEQRRMADLQDLALREDLRRRQAHHAAEVAALNREVEHFRAEARSAVTVVQAAVEQTNARLQSKEAELTHLQQESLHQADKEAMALGNVRVQVTDLQNELANITRQLKIEQDKRHSEALTHASNLKQLEAQLLEAQDGIVKRTITMMESKAAAFNKAVQDLNTRIAERNDEARANTEMAFSAIVRASSKTEKTRQQRVGAIEGVIMDVAAATAAAMSQLQTKIETGVAHLGTMVDSACTSAEAREAEMREQVNMALRRIKAYAQEMEDSLEQDRLRLEEVVKMEIKSRMISMNKIREELGSANTAIEEKLKVVSAHLVNLEGGHQQHAAQIGQHVDVSSILRRDVDELTTAAVNAKVEMGKMKEAYESQLAWLVTSVTEATGQLKAERDARAQGLAEMQQMYNQGQDDVRKKLDSHSQQILSLEAHLENLNAEVVQRLEQLETQLEGSELAAQEERVATKAELDKRLGESRREAAEKLECAIQELRKALDASKQELQEAAESNKGEVAKSLQKESQERERMLLANKEQLQAAIEATREQALVDKKEMLDHIAADKQAYLAAEEARQKAKQEAEKLQPDDMVAAGRYPHGQEDYKDALTVALVAAGIPSIEAACKPGMLPVASAQHSKSLMNDLTLAKLAERVTSMEVHQQQHAGDSEQGSPIGQQLKDLQQQMQNFLVHQQHSLQLGDLQRQMQGLQQELQSQQQGASSADAQASQQQLEGLQRRMGQLSEGRNTLPVLQQQVDDLQQQAAHSHEEVAGIHNQLSELQNQMHLFREQRPAEAYEDLLHQITLAGRLEDLQHAGPSVQLAREVGEMEERLKGMEALQQEQQQHQGSYNELQKDLVKQVEALQDRLQGLKAGRPTEDLDRQVGALEQKSQELEARNLSMGRQVGALDERLQELEAQQQGIQQLAEERARLQQLLQDLKDEREQAEKDKVMQAEDERVHCAGQAMVALGIDLSDNEHHPGVDLAIAVLAALSCTPPEESLKPGLKTVAAILRKMVQDPEGAAQDPTLGSSSYALQAKTIDPTSTIYKPGMLAASVALQAMCKSAGRTTSGGASKGSNVVSVVAALASSGVDPWSTECRPGFEAAVVVLAALLKDPGQEARKLELELGKAILEALCMCPTDDTHQPGMAACTAIVTSLTLLGSPNHAKDQPGARAAQIALGALCSENPNDPKATISAAAEALAAKGIDPNDDKYKRGILAVLATLRVLSSNWDPNAPQGGTTHVYKSYNLDTNSLHAASIREMLSQRMMGGVLANIKLPKPDFGPVRGMEVKGEEGSDQGEEEGGSNEEGGVVLQSAQLAELEQRLQDLQRGLDRALTALGIRDSDSAKDPQSAAVATRPSANQDLTKIDNSAKGSSHLNLEEACKRFATLASVERNWERIQTDSQKTYQNEQAILQAMKEMNNKFTAHLDSLAKVVIRTAQQVDILHNTLIDMGYDPGAPSRPRTVLAMKPSGSAEAVGRESKGAGQQQNATPVRPSVQSMKPLLKSSGMRALVANQDTLGRESSVDRALRLTYKEPEGKKPSNSGGPAENAGTDLDHPQLSTVLEVDEDKSDRGRSQEASNKMRSLIAAAPGVHPGSLSPERLKPEARNRLQWSDGLSADSSTHDGKGHSRARVTEESSQQVPSGPGMGWQVVQPASRRRYMAVKGVEAIKDRTRAKEEQDRMHIDNLLHQPNTSIFAESIERRQQRMAQSAGPPRRQNNAGGSDQESGLRSTSEPRKPGQQAYSVNLASGRSSNPSPQSTASQLRPPPGSILPGQSVNNGPLKQLQTGPSRLSGML